MGGDRCVLWGNTAFKTGEPKVFEIEGEEGGRFLIGGCGSIRGINPIQHGFTPPRHKDGIADMLYMITEFLPALQKAMKVTRAIYAENGKVNADVWTLVGYRNNLYCVEAFEVIHIDDREFAVGSGMEFALGSLYTTKDSEELTAEERITWALESSAFYNPYVVEPFDILTLPGVDIEE